ncbi:effector-associated domain 2-containing protein, partial [Klebsiella aerogenes]|uniref:effector-associated domain 2-containing protein n=1 Tax=Klebsiella aerogenes TaxID=548 RepID=UPI0019538627
SAQSSIALAMGSGGLGGLVEVVRVFHQGSRPMAHLDELLACLFPDRLLTSTEYEELPDLLE